SSSESRDVACWHKAEVPSQPDNVRCWGLKRTCPSAGKTAAIDWSSIQRQQPAVLLDLDVSAAARPFDSERTYDFPAIPTWQPSRPSGRPTSPSAPPPEDSRPNCVKIQSYLAPG